MGARLSADILRPLLRAWVPYIPEGTRKRVRFLADLSNRKNTAMNTDPATIDKLRALWQTTPEGTSEKATGIIHTLAAPDNPLQSGARTHVRTMPTDHPPLAVGAEPPRLCSWHLDVNDWQDEPAPGRAGWIRTSSRKCGTFIGYRTAERNELNSLDPDCR